MSKSKKYLLITGLVVTCIIAFFSWYKIRYSMDVVQSFEVSTPNAKHRLLIATQGSSFKDAVVSGVIDALKDRPISINVIDVSGLSRIDIDEWSVLVILHTWENWQAQSDAKQFIDDLDPSNIEKVIVLTTSGRGDYKMPGLDAITSASVISDVPRNVATVMQRLNALIIK